MSSCDNNFIITLGTFEFKSQQLFGTIKNPENWSEACERVSDLKDLEIVPIPEGYQEVIVTSFDKRHFHNPNVSFVSSCLCASVLYQSFL